MTGTIEAIWRKRAHRGPMDPVDRAELVTGEGMAGNADVRTKRQVTLIEAEAWEAVRDALGAPALDPGLRRANVLLRGVRLADSRSRVLRLGGARIRIHGETRPCRLMDDAHPGLQEALRPPWRGGAYGVVLEGGPIAVGDSVEWDD